MYIELFNQRGFSMKFKLFTYLFAFVFAVGFPTLGFSNASESQSIEKNQSTTDAINQLMDKPGFQVGVGVFAATVGGFNLGLGASVMGLEMANSASPYLGAILLSIGVGNCYMAFKSIKD